MEQMTIISEMIPIFRQVFKNEDLVLTPYLTVSDIDNWDSMNNFIMVTELEKHFNIRFTLRDLNSLKTVNDIASKIYAKLQ